MVPLRVVHIDRLLETLIKRRGSELRIQCGRPAQIYVDGTFVDATARDLTINDVTMLIRALTPDTKQLELERTGQTRYEFDFGGAASFDVSGLG